MGNLSGGAGRRRAWLAPVRHLCLWGLTHRRRWVYEQPKWGMSRMGQKHRIDNYVHRLVTAKPLFLRRFYGSLRPGNTGVTRYLLGKSNMTRHYQSTGTRPSGTRAGTGVGARLDTCRGTQVGCRPQAAALGILAVVAVAHWAIQHFGLGVHFWGWPPQQPLRRALVRLQRLKTLLQGCPLGRAVRPPYSVVVKYHRVELVIFLGGRVGAPEQAAELIVVGGGGDSTRPCKRRVVAALLALWWDRSRLFGGRSRLSGRGDLDPPRSR
jgi:hypothetical protein